MVTMDFLEQLLSGTLDASAVAHWRKYGAIKENTVDTSTDLEFALQEQLMYNEEDLRLTIEGAELALLALSTFECSVCLEEYSEEYVAVIEGCGHRYCRDCIRGHVSSKLGDRRFPIFCPSCVADNRSQEPVGQCYLPLDFIPTCLKTS